jgi:hypothetical protein
LTVPPSRDLAPNTPRSAELEADALRLYRRICVLRATGETTAADHLESGDFARALAAASANPHSDSAPGFPAASKLDRVSVSDRGDESWQARLAAERRRVEDAQLLAELLVPLLAERLSDSLSANLALVGEPGSAAAAAAAAKKAKASRARVTPSAPLEIADFIEGMLAQERAEVRERSVRQAS